MRKWIRRLKLCLDLPMAGLAMVGAYWTLPVAEASQDKADASQERDVPAIVGPPPGHPERLIDNQPLTPAELTLWASLGEINW
jgi:hypothetical protein